jgi:hypothetical protein
MFYVKSCNGYNVIAQTRDMDEALRIARTHRDGTYACIICRDGRVVGDSVDGFYRGALVQEDWRDREYAAGYDYACGYRD